LSMMENGHSVQARNIHNLASVPSPSHRRIMEHAIIYDCDGTLIDSEHIAGTVCAEALTSVGIPMTMEQFNTRFTGIPAARTWEILKAEIPFSLPEGFNEDQCRDLPAL
jgi:hypothetical protein